MVIALAAMAAAALVQAMVTDGWATLPCPPGRRGMRRARDQYAALLPIRERVLGPEHPETQAAREKLAYWADEAEGDVSRGEK